MTVDKGRRKRRLASDEAHAWARSIKLNNPHAKDVLKSLALYVNDEASCFVSIGQLADDCDLSEDTVRKRLKFLEEVGTILRFPRWRDESGRANSDGRGKRTTDEIRLLVEADIDEIEAAARGETPPESDKFSPRSEQGLKSDAEEFSPRPALGQPSHSGKGLISEPEPEDSPPAPSARGSLARADVEEERRRKEIWRAMLAIYPGIATMDQHAGRSEFEQLSLDDAEWAVTAATPYAGECSKLRKPPKNVHIWLRKAMFKNFARGGPAPARPDSYAADSPEGRAVLALHQVARKTILTIAGRVTYRGEITPQLLAFAQAGERSAWPWIESSEATRDQIAAWARFIEAHVPGPRGTLLDTKGLGEALRSGVHAPWPWPPKKDGTIYRDNPASPEEPDHA